MSKIYSRPRINLPKIFIYSKFNNKGKKIFFKTFIIIIIAFSTVKIVLDAILPIFDKLCEDKAKSIATVVSNEQATIVMREHKYEDLYTIEKDNEGNIIMIKSNVGPINEIISDVAIKIQNEIDKRGKENIKISLGGFTGFKLLSGEGPSIPIKISTVGTVETELRSEFTEKGINQTLHRIYLQVECELSILSAFDGINKKITNQVLIAENIIVGRIPNTYYNLKGIDNGNLLDVLE